MSTFTLAIPGLPGHCPYCGWEPDHWPIRYHAGEVILACPHCHSRIGRVVAIPGEEVNQHDNRNRRATGRHRGLPR